MLFLAVAAIVEEKERNGGGEEGGYLSSYNLNIIERFTYGY